MKYQITLDQYEMEALLKIVYDATEEGKVHRTLYDRISEKTKIIFEPKNEGA